MKKVIISLFLTIISISNIIAQVNNFDSINNEKKIENIRKNVQTLFEQQNKRFNNELKDLKEEFVIYFTPIYKDRGTLMYDLYKMNDQLEMQYNYVKQSCFTENLTIPEKVIKYSNFLINKTNGYWCENRFGYDKLKGGDDLGILFVFSPKNIPDSLSILKLKEFTTSAYEYQTKEKKRMVDLALLQSNYINMSEGLNERFIRVVLKY